MWKVGLVTLPYGIVNAFVSFTFGHLVKYIGRLPVFITGLLTHQISGNLSRLPLYADGEVKGD